MTSDLNINKAREIYRGFFGRHGKKNSRIHEGAAYENVARLRAIEGKCGTCTHLIVEFLKKDGKEAVSLRCLDNLSPLELYIDTAPGEQPYCRGHISKER